MNKKGKIIIIALIFIALLVAGLLIWQKVKPTISSNLSKTYTKENIKINKKDDIELEYNIYDKYIGIVIKSINKDISRSRFNFDYKDNKGNIIKTEVKELLYMKNGLKYVLTTELPEVNDYVGDIIISIDCEYTENLEEIYPRNLLKLEMNKEIIDTTKITKMTLTGDNIYKKDLKLIYGAIVLYKNKEIINVGYFYKENITAIDKIILETNFNSINENNELKEIEYDNYETIINYIS